MGMTEIIIIVLVGVGAWYVGKIITGIIDKFVDRVMMVGMLREAMDICGGWYEDMIEKITDSLDLD